mgnify:CR=1 FL=1
MNRTALEGHLLAALTHAEEGHAETAALHLREAVAALRSAPASPTPVQGVPPLFTVETFEVEMVGAFAHDGHPGEGPVLLAEDATLAAVAMKALEYGCDVAYLPVNVRGSFVDDVAAQIEPGPPTPTDTRGAPVQGVPGPLEDQS